MAEEPWRAVEHGENIALTIAWQWAIAVRSQAERITTSSGIARLPDAYLLILAVRNVRRAAVMASQHVRTDEAHSRIVAAITLFDDELPGAEAVRDVLEHFDAYSQGTGHRQQPQVRLAQRQPDEILAGQYSIHFEPAKSAPTSLTVRVGRHNVDLSKSPRAAAELVNTLKSAIADEQGAATGPRDDPAP